MDSHSSRALLVVRLALLAVTLCVAVAVYGARFRDDPSPSRVQLNGRTSQGFPVWAVQRGGRLREVHVIWRGTCTRGSDLPWSTYTVRDTQPTFEAHGRRFESWVAYRFFGGDGWKAHVTMNVRGGLAANGHAAKGVLVANAWWKRGGEVGGECESGPVSWRVTAAG
jgi:hypothetical protein